MDRPVHHVLLQCFFPQGSHFLDHILTTACNEKERFMGLIRIFLFYFNCGYSTVQETIKEAYGIYGELTCIILGVISADPRLWVTGLFNNLVGGCRLCETMAVSTVSKWYKCHVLPSICRTVSSL